MYTKKALLSFSFSFVYGLRNFLELKQNIYDGKLASLFVNGKKLKYVLRAIRILYAAWFNFQQMFFHQRKTTAPYFC
jgi:hypothetical protein